MPPGWPAEQNKPRKSNDFNGGRFCVPYFNGVNAVSRICVSSASVITAAPIT